jgi:hypothetical protein
MCFLYTADVQLIQDLVIDVSIWPVGKVAYLAHGAAECVFVYGGRTAATNS